jgi:predicted nucleotidyltransferase
MAGLSSQEQKALHIFKQKAMESFENQLHSIQLFGSKARGNAH